jgi:hypothetical protein
MAKLSKRSASFNLRATIEGKQLETNGLPM